MHWDKIATPRSDQQMWDCGFWVRGILEEKSRESQFKPGAAASLSHPTTRKYTSTANDTTLYAVGIATIPVPAFS